MDTPSPCCLRFVVQCESSGQYLNAAACWTPTIAYAKALDTFAALAVLSALRLDFKNEDFRLVRVDPKKSKARAANEVDGIHLATCPRSAPSGRVAHPHGASSGRETVCDEEGKMNHRAPAARSTSTRSQSKRINIIRNLIRSRTVRGNFV
jgi:hypothetical protein